MSSQKFPFLLPANTALKCPYVPLKISSFWLQTVWTSHQKYLVLLTQTAGKFPNSLLKTSSFLAENCDNISLKTRTFAANDTNGICPEISPKTSCFIATNIAGKSPDILLKTFTGFMLLLSTFILTIGWNHFIIQRVFLVGTTLLLKTLWLEERLPNSGNGGKIWAACECSIL